MYFKDTRLSIYKAALKDYRRSLFMPLGFNVQRGTDLGFCRYFFTKNIEFKDLPELYNQNKSVAYWFPIGKLRPRIKCLKKAIKEIAGCSNWHHQWYKNYDHEVKYSMVGTGKYIGGEEIMRKEAYVVGTCKKCGKKSYN